MNYGEGGQYCACSGQFWGSLEAKRGQNAYFCAPGKTLLQCLFQNGGASARAYGDLRLF